MKGTLSGVDHVTSVPKERPHVPVIDRHMLRYQLFQEIRERGYYRNDIVVTLRPLWKKAIAEASPDPWAKSVPQLWALGQVPGHPALAAYVAAVQTYTSERLRITRHMQPVMWAATFVHVDVE